MSKNKRVDDNKVKSFEKNLTQTNPVAPSVKENVLRVLDTGALYRYNVAHGDSEVSLLEKDFAGFVKSKYAIAVTSCSSAMYIALKCANVEPGDKVLIPAFTFTAVPSSVVHANAIPVIVEITEDYVIDLDDLRNKITVDTKVLLLSHMRGHVGNMDEIVKICNSHNIFLIEDAAHSLGILWDGKQTGTIGKIGCYSLQDYKIIRSGEGGIFVTDDDEIAAKAIIYAGSYEKLWKTHLLAPEIIEKYEKIIPTFNFRMSNITAAIVRPQLQLLDERIKKHNQNYSTLLEVFAQCKHIKVAKCNPRTTQVFDSLQFRLIDRKLDELELFEARCNESGIPVQLFGGRKVNARCFWNWGFLKNINDCPKTRKILDSSFDMRLSLSLTEDDMRDIGNTIIDIINDIDANH